MGARSENECGDGLDLYLGSTISAIVLCCPYFMSE